MEYGVFSPLLLKIRENPPHDISEGRGIVASHHQFLSIREQGRHCQFILEIPWSVYQKERGSVGRGKRKGCLGQSCENSDLWNSLFSKRKIPTLEQSMKERDLVSPKWPVSPQAASSLVDESSGWKISGKFSSSEFSCNNFHTLCGKFKIMRVFKQLLEDTESDQVQGEAMGNLTLHSGATWPSHICGSPREHVSNLLIQGCHSSRNSQGPERKRMEFGGSQKG